MDEAKLALAVNWLRSVVEKTRISPSINNFELPEIDDGRYRLTFEMAGAEKTLHLSAEELEAIADGDETIRESVKPGCSGWCGCEANAKIKEAGH